MIAIPIIEPMTLTDKFIKKDFRSVDFKTASEINSHKNDKTKYKIAKAKGAKRIVNTASPNEKFKTFMKKPKSKRPP